MIPEVKFQKKPKNFWAQVRLISMTLGYSKGDDVKTYSIEQIVDCLKFNNLGFEHLLDPKGGITDEGQSLIDYFKYRALMLKTVVEPNLMTREGIKDEFEKLQKHYTNSVIPIPYNKQKGDKRHYAYLTAIVMVRPGYTRHTSQGHGMIYAYG